MGSKYQDRRGNTSSKHAGQRSKSERAERELFEEDFPELKAVIVG